MSVLVDCSIWIQYLRGHDPDHRMDELIDEGLILTNDLILTELLPALMIRKQSKLLNLLRQILALPLHIDWEEIRQFQYICLRKGINKVGVPDLIIAQNAKNNDVPIFSGDRHFALMAKPLGFELF